MGAIKVIETRYLDYNFRSRLEARWAVYLDALQVPFEYEMEGFHLPSGNYLPDFWLPEQGCWLEIKPTMPEMNSREVRLATELADGTQRVVVIAAGQPAGHRLMVYVGDATDGSAGIGWWDDEDIRWEFDIDGLVIDSQNNHSTREFFHPDIGPPFKAMKLAKDIDQSENHFFFQHEAEAAAKSARFGHERGWADIPKDIEESLRYYRHLQNKGQLYGNPNRDSLTAPPG